MYVLALGYLIYLTQFEKERPYLFIIVKTTLSNVILVIEVLLNKCNSGVTTFSSLLLDSTQSDFIKLLHSLLYFIETGFILLLLRN